MLGLLSGKFKLAWYVRYGALSGRAASGPLPDCPLPGSRPRNAVSHSRTVAQPDLANTSRSAVGEMGVVDALEGREHETWKKAGRDPVKKSSAPRRSLNQDR